MVDLGLQAVVHFWSVCRYGFSTDAAAQEFQQRPAAYVAALHKHLHAKPHLLAALGFLDSSLPQFVANVVDLNYSAIKCDMGTQTPTHIVESKIDHRCATSAKWLL